jgi:hypothetical protein
MDNERGRRGDEDGDDTSRALTKTYLLWLMLFKISFFPVCSVRLFLFLLLKYASPFKVLELERCKAQPNPRIAVP